MKKLLIPSFLLISLLSYSQSSKTALIPQPVSVSEKPGSFALKNNFIISIAGKADEATKVARQLADALSSATGFNGSIKENSTGGSIQLVLLPAPDNSIGNEGYNLSVTPAFARINANKPAGLFYGMQKLLQLFPKEIESKSKVAGVNWSAPCTEITDQPRFGWRGLMFDVSLWLM